MIQRLCKTPSADDGSSTLEFVLLFPLFLSVFMWIIETGFVAFQSVQLDRGVDLTVRELMLDDITSGLTDTQAHELLVTKICEKSALLSCQDNLKLNMQQINSSSGALDTVIDCTNRVERINPLYQPEYSLNFGACASGDTSLDPEIIFMQACLVFDPIMPSGLQMPWSLDNSGGLRLISRSAFVNEPC